MKSSPGRPPYWRRALRASGLVPRAKPGIGDLEIASAKLPLAAYGCPGPHFAAISADTAIHHTVAAEAYVSPDRPAKAAANWWTGPHCQAPSQALAPKYSRSSA